MRWTPSTAGRWFTQSVDWRLEVEDDQFELVINARPLRGSVSHLRSVRIQPGWVWSSLQLPGNGGSSVVLDGLPNAHARALEGAIAHAVERMERRERDKAALEAFPSKALPLVEWARRSMVQAEDWLHRRGWLDQDFVQRLAQDRPSGLEDWLQDPVIEAHVAGLDGSTRQALHFYRQPLAPWARAQNDRWMAKRLRDDRAFFDQAESSPLTEEQRRAVICLDSRVLLVASAGSGKTSTLVAKAAYVLQHGHCAPERVLMLAFNHAAAAELRQRIRDRLTPLGLPGDRVTAQTFHAFGLDVIGQATGRKPTVAPWLDNGRELETLLALVDALKDRDPLFRSRWDLFRIVLGQDLPAPGDEGDSPDGWDREAQRSGYWTLQNEVVKSRGEQMLANWLFYNGVRYEYERPYEHDTADASHRQYRPDFYLPDAQAYLEHWALDEKGQPPPEFTGYKESMAWKRALHQRHGTRLLETTVAGLWSGEAFVSLEKALTALGVRLDPNPDRPVPGRQPIQNPRLARTIRTFMLHVKNNRIGIGALRERMARGSAGRFRFRHALFLDLFEPIERAWEEALRAEGFVDFEDMLHQAADHIEQGRWRSPYELVMVDEFQDASHARARLIKALTAQRDTRLFAVGDDWQSINRFAGADLSVMTRFSEWFGPSTTMKLETTFRCPPSLCEISGRFVQQNPAQLRKTVRSVRADVADPVQITQVPHERLFGAAVTAQLQQLAAEADAAQQTLQVFVMGRYRQDRDLMPQGFEHPRLKVSFVTAHASKGLECDHVILPRMTNETLGFPSRVEDDPVMALAMPQGDAHPYSEERRLFYVALTRARRSVRLITLQNRISSFVLELAEAHGLALQHLNPDLPHSTLCPECGQGVLALRRGPYGHFEGCSAFPRCRYTRKPDPPSPSPTVQQRHRPRPQTP